MIPHDPSVWARTFLSPQGLVPILLDAHGLPGCGILADAGTTVEERRFSAA
ncbi:MAG TPA: hypothetical protein VMP68_15200 [Candidatus Eisenbacteria bacterium]|nr:hypothetical protein [Candidatus Eisenbacteria bacterium]